ncbi:hypothetical protein MKX01_006691, partial [Papaver californicum]
FIRRVIDLPPVEIKENDVCVKMLASPINPSDINRIQGVYPVRPPLPAIGGYEGVGEVHDFGSVLKGLSLGADELYTESQLEVKNVKVSWYYYLL